MLKLYVSLAIAAIVLSPASSVKNIKALGQVDASIEEEAERAIWPETNCLKCLSTYTYWRVDHQLCSNTRFLNCEEQIDNSKRETCPANYNCKSHVVTDENDDEIHVKIQNFPAFSSCDFKITNNQKSDLTITSSFADSRL
jgi:hypothetical protein